MTSFDLFCMEGHPLSSVWFEVTEYTIWNYMPNLPFKHMLKVAHGNAQRVKNAKKWKLLRKYTVCLCNMM